MKIKKEITMNWERKMIDYYSRTNPFEEEKLIIDTIRLSEPCRLYRVLCSCAYLGMDRYFAGGVLTKEILRATAWKMPDRATDLQLEQDKIISDKLEQKCRKYISQKMVVELQKRHGLVLPVEWRMFYIPYVPGTIFTLEERDFMKNNPCWLLSLLDNPPHLGKVVETN